MTPLFPDHLPAATLLPRSIPTKPGRSPRRLALAAIAGLALLVGACSDKAAPAAPSGPVEGGVVTLESERQTVTTELP